VLLGATFTATRASRDQAEDASKPAAQQQSAAPSKPKQNSEPASKPTAQKSESSAASRQADEPVERTRAARRPLAKPAAVARAIGQRRVVVLAFFQPGADDRATASAVSSLRGRRLAAVFTDKIDNVSRYEPVVGALGIHQAPAVVIVDSKRRARVIEGYVDPESLAQEVADVRG
jgi:hypothetical protein